jgi:hypothetical protein
MLIRMACEPRVTGRLFQNAEDFANHPGAIHVKRWTKPAFFTAAPTECRDLTRLAVRED